MAELGEVVTETLEEIPRQSKVIQTVRERVARRACEAMTQVPAPSQVIPHGCAGPGLLVTVLELKFGPLLPLNRQSETFDREGIELDMSTLPTGSAPVALKLPPLVGPTWSHVLAAQRFHCDDDTVPVLAKNRTKIGRFWTHVRDDRP